MFRSLVLLTFCVLALNEVALGEQGQPVATDQFGDPLPPGAIARLGSLRWRHDGQVTFATFSADGKNVVTACRDGTIRVWEFPSGKEIRRITPPGTDRVGHMIDCASQTSDGKTLAGFGGGEKIYLHDIATGKELRGLTVKSRLVGLGPVHSGFASLTFSPDGANLTFLDSDSTIRIWDWLTAKEVRSFGGPTKPGKGVSDLDAFSLGYTPDGKSLVVGYFGDGANTGHTVKLWNPATGMEIWSIRIAGSLFSAHLKALAAKPPLETRLWLEQLRQKMTASVLQGARLRQFRAVEVLELIGTPEARQGLQALANGAPDALLTSSAQAALKR